ncbi:DUF4178 domain-containing protein [Parasulfitobacter algicola]|uniref:DUF4178 domain-containing protein n=1 Tax=Parasulfitobacter algicola TaxID=2614809 RepID=A0ABX2IKE6_9RHOB|nr:DUF4178 domain-containing protein [Sulfitobacter algicola]NSX53337.1 DUF4178 domain-containing protein [Sulfitobacter algicola]
MIDCDACGTTVFLQDGVFKNAGQRGEMHDTQMLFGLKDTVRILEERYYIAGHVRYSYGRGWWDEFWAVKGNGDGVWLSIDEGDVVSQRSLPKQDHPPEDTFLYVGETVTVQGQLFTATEVSTAECMAFRGEFPEILHVGEKYRFINYTSEHGALLSGEITDDDALWFIGTWIDPFDVKKDQSH